MHWVTTGNFATTAPRFSRTGSIFGANPTTSFEG